MHPGRLYQIPCDLRKSSSLAYHILGACISPYSAWRRRHTLSGRRIDIAVWLLYVDLLVKVAVKEGHLDVHLM